MQPSLNGSSRRTTLFWTRSGNATPAEVKALLRQIESKADASRYREMNLRALQRRDDALADAISRCTTADPCAEVLCPACARRYRLWLTSRLLRLATRPTPAFIATILLEAVHGAELSDVELNALHERARKRLTREGVLAAIGGTEASYEAEHDRWVIHLHLLVFDTLESGRAKLRRAFHDSTLNRPVFCQALRDRVAQLSYLQKFQTYHRPGSGGSRKRGRAYPLKPEQIDQLAQWTRHFWFQDFLFVLGLRRRGSRFDYESGFKRALVDGRRNVRIQRDGGDGGDASSSHGQNGLARRITRTSSVAHSKRHSDRLYRDPDSKRAIRDDKNRAPALAIPRARSPPSPNGRHAACVEFQLNGRRTRTRK
jgi:hypothetical protein